eukprot:scaffold19367_cov108-Cylindrotheca_fusiformis.AAC.1
MTGWKYKGLLVCLACVLLFLPWVVWLSQRAERERQVKALVDHYKTELEPGDHLYCITKEWMLIEATYGADGVARDTFGGRVDLDRCYARSAVEPKKTPDIT